MEILLPMVTGAVLLGIGSVIGYVAGRRVRSVAAPDDPFKPICECQHHRGTHAKNGGPCNADYERNEDGYRRWRRCPCLSYQGPIPATEMLMLPTRLPQGYEDTHP